MNVLILNEGCFDGFEYCVKSIRTFSPCETIHVFENNFHPSNDYIHVDITPYEYYVDKLKRLYIYKYSGCDAESLKIFDTLWMGIKRWIYFLNYCLENNIGSFWTMDNDVLCFSDLCLKKMMYDDGSDLSIIKCTGDSVTLGTACFNNLNPLIMFCEWLFKHVESNAIYTHYDDMYLWELFLKEYREIKVTNLLTVINYSSFDHHMQVIDGWLNDGLSKTLEWENGHPYGYHNGKMEYLNSLHCWGIWKVRMKELWAKSRESCIKYIEMG